MNTDGYTVYRNQVKDPLLTDLLDCFDDQTVHYSRLKSMLVTKFLSPSARATKFRASNANNSSDAAYFHRDIQCQTRDPLPPCWTVLIYLDPSEMEVVPGSHLDRFMSYGKALKRWSTRRKITFQRGDVLVFNAALLHRGVFTANLAPDRRLIQIFEVYENDALFEKWSARTAQVEAPTGTKTPKMLIKLAQMPVISSVMNFFVYLNGATGYNGLARADWKRGFTVISSRASQVRVRTDREPSNRYCMIETETNSLECRSKFRWSAFTRQYLTYLTTIVIFIATLVWIYRLPPQ